MKKTKTKTKPAAMLALGVLLLCTVAQSELSQDQVSHHREILGRLTSTSTPTSISPSVLRQAFGGHTSVFLRNCVSDAERVAKAMGLVESGGKPVKGSSGEACSIWQWLPTTWEIISHSYNQEVRGFSEPLPLNVRNEEIVTIWKCGKFLAEGYTPKEIGMIWNTSLGGNEWPLIRKGVNTHGVAYDSEYHGEKVAAMYKKVQ